MGNLSFEEALKLHLAAERKQRRMFDRWAKGNGKPGTSYNEMTDGILHYVAPERLVEMALPFLDARKPIMDIGAGTGKVGLALSRYGFVVDGLDFSKGMLEKAAQTGCYRNLIFDSVTEIPIRRLAGESHPFTEQYSQAISVGVYGDWASAFFLPYLLDCLGNPAVIAIAGSVSFTEEAAAMEPLEDLLKGFRRVQMEVGVGHYYRSGEAIKYLYAVAAR